MSLIRCMCHNRARQRDKLAFLLDEFAILQDEVHQCLYIIKSRRTYAVSECYNYGLLLLYHYGK